MGVVACVRTRAQLLTLLSCTYIQFTALAQKSKTVDKGRMSITVDHGYYRPAFVVLDTTLFDQVGDFQMALRPGFLPHRLALWRAGVRGMAVGACGCNMWVMALSLLLGLTHASSAIPPPPAIPPIGGEPLLSHPLYGVSQSFHYAKSSATAYVAADVSAGNSHERSCCFE